MPLTLPQIHTYARDSVFLNRVEAAIVNKAAAVLTEVNPNAPNPEPEDFKYRKDFAAAIVANPPAYAQRFAYTLLAVVTGQIDPPNTDDATIQTRVNQHYDNHARAESRRQRTGA
jgi:hypothetical protein